MNNNTPDQSSATSAELPRWQCHKKVWAAKITHIDDPTEPGNESDGRRIITLQGPYASFFVDHEYVQKHNPQVGGYYVVYPDGYKSYSPADAFESGYTKIERDDKLPNSEKKAPSLKSLLEILHAQPELSSAEEVKCAVEKIIRVQNLAGGELDTIIGAFKNGPLWDGDVPSKSARSTLLEEGYMAKVVVKGQQGYNALTYKGYYLYKLIEAGV